jgi:hypothetical protein
VVPINEEPGTQLLLAPSQKPLLSTVQPCNPPKPRRCLCSASGTTGRTHRQAAARSSRRSRSSARATRGTASRCATATWCSRPPANPRDQHQHWYKDMRFSSQVKDEEGCPGFSLVNAATGRPSSTPPPSPTLYTSLAFSCSSV